MKKLYTTLAFLLVITAVFGQPGRRNNRYNNFNNYNANTNYYTATSALHLTLTAYSNYSITIAGQAYSFYGNQFFFENITPGYMQISITRPGNNGGTWQTVYNGIINFENNTRIFAAIDNMGVLRVTQREVILQQQQPQPQQPPVTQWPNNPTPGYPQQVVFASQQQVTALVEQLKNTSFESNKTKTAKAAIKGQYFTAEQVKQILMTFSFDSNKLDVAKYAYDLSYDKGNFYIVGAAFSFSSTADQLQDYILSH